MKWLTDIIRGLFFFIDEVIYGCVETVYSLFIEIANTTIFTKDMIDVFAGKVYALVGIFMLFKVSFSILTYIVNPDEFHDKNKGIAKLAMNIIISLVLLVAVPFVFDQAMDIQRIILKDDIIPKLFSFKNNNQEIYISSQDSSQGSQIALLTFTTFYNAPGDFSNLEDVFATEVNAKDASGNGYANNYDYLISTVVGVVLVLIFVSFCFDIAVRSVKLGFLRILAPIPIISRVDPKKGNDIFNKWTENCVSTYLDLFIRLVAIFFAIYIIRAMKQSMFTDAITGDKYSPDGWTGVFILLGVLMFAKQLPKLLEDLLGVKLSGSFSLNPIKKIEKEALGGRFLRATAGAGIGLGMGAVGAATGAGALRPLTGLASGLIAGFQGKKLSDIQKANLNANQRMRRAINENSTWGDRMGVRFDQAIGNTTEVDRIKADEDRITREENAINDEIDRINRAQSLQRVRMENNESIIKAQSEEEARALKRIQDGNAGSLSIEYNRRQAYIENLKSRMAAFQQQSTDINLTQAQRDYASYEAETLESTIATQTQADADWLNTTAMYRYIDSRGAVDAGMSQDAALVNLIASTNELARVHGVTIHADAQHRHGDSGRLRGDNSAIQTSFYAQDANKAEYKRQLDAHKETKRQLAEQRRIAQANYDAVNRG